MFGGWQGYLLDLRNSGFSAKESKSRSIKLGSVKDIILHLFDNLNSFIIIERLCENGRFS